MGTYVQSSKNNWLSNVSIQHQQISALLYLRQRGRLLQTSGKSPQTDFSAVPVVTRCASDLPLKIEEIKPAVTIGARYSLHLRSYWPLNLLNTFADLATPCNTRPGDRRSDFSHLAGEVVESEELGISGMVISHMGLC